jgi:hypothetical protein
MLKNGAGQVGGLRDYGKSPQTICDESKKEEHFAADVLLFYCADAGDDRPYGRRVTSAYGQPESV